MTARTEYCDSIAIVSGGLDSTTLVYDMLSRNYTPHLLSFNYGQRHKKELTYAAATAKQLMLRHDIVDLTGLTNLISNSALTSPEQYDGALNPYKRDIEVPDGHYAEETMKATVVPNRNMIMLAIAAGVAVNNKYQVIGVGVHAGDHFVYPDCRPDFISAMRQAILTGNEGFHNFTAALGGSPTILAPYINASKAEIAFRGLKLGVPFHMTWSCYKGGDKHCGRCGTCVERLEAISAATSRYFAERGGHIVDLSEYEDSEYWKVVTRGTNRNS